MTTTLPTTNDYYALSGLISGGYVTGQIDGSIVHKPDRVTVEGAGGLLTLYWDARGALFRASGDDEGWAWRLRDPEGAEESGPLDSLAEARRLAARALGRPVPSLYAVGTATEGMPADGGEQVEAPDAEFAAALYVLGGEWGGATTVEVAVAPVADDGTIDRDQAQRIAVELPPPNLTTTDSDGELVVVDAEGGVWRPERSLQAAAQSLPPALASKLLRSVCHSSPMRGSWAQ